MSIVRVGMGENNKYSDGFNAIFGKKKPAKAAATAAVAAPATKKTAPTAKKAAPTKKAAAVKKPAAKKASKKK